MAYFIAVLLVFTEIHDFGYTTCGLAIQTMIDHDVIFYSDSAR